MSWTGIVLRQNNVYEKGIKSEYVKWCSINFYLKFSHVLVFKEAMQQKTVTNQAPNKYFKSLILSHIRTLEYNLW